MSTTSDEFIPTRQSLLLRLKDWGDTGGWQDFFDTYWKLIYSVARRSGLSEAEAQDVVQETVISVAKKMQGFIYDPAIGSFKGWLMQVTRRRINDQFRRKHYHVGDKRFPREQVLDTQIIENQPAEDPVIAEDAWNEEWQRNAVEASLEKVKAKTDPKQFQIFYLHVIKGIPAREVAERLNVKLAQVYLAKYRVASVFKKQIKILENKGF